MIEVTQTLHGDLPEGVQGNCFAACLASILHVDIETVPNDHTRKWRSVVNTWLRQYGLAMVQASNDFDELCRDDDITDCWCIATGHTNRHPTVRHACVAKSGVIVWDPHPSRSGLVSIDGYVLLLVLDASRYAQHVAEISNRTKYTPTHEHTPIQENDHDTPCIQI